MLTRLFIRNLKMFGEAEVELGSPVVFIGPNNSGKTTALQALALWKIGLDQWQAKRGGKASPEKRPGVTINRRDLTSIPVPSANLLWRRTEVRRGLRGIGENKTQNIRIEIKVEGISTDRAWACGLEFDFSNEESFVCRPARLPGFEDKKVQEAKFSEIPDEALRVQLAYLPPMSGLTTSEPKWELGRIRVLIGEGQTAQVIRNLCFHVHEAMPSNWERICGHMDSLFRVRLLPPKYIAERGEITMEYKDASGSTLDLASAGRGLLQTLLLLSHLHANPGSVLLLDEPDAHLEILRQRQTFRLISDLAETQGSQIIAASHSEIVLNEAAGCGTVVAFVGKPHRINDKGSQLMKALSEIGFDQYLQAEQTGWVLYVESAGDLAILQAFAESLNHPAKEILRNPFVHYVSTNLPQRARDHFFGLQEAKRDLVGIGIFDNLDKVLQNNEWLLETMWSRREIENYFCTEEVLMAFARNDLPTDLFGLAEKGHRERVMRETIREVSVALATLGHPSPWDPKIKASDEFLDPLFKKFFAKLRLPLAFRKSDYHNLARLLPKRGIDSEVVEKLDLIVTTARRATPRVS
ncbi:MAG: hypothetical protein GHCLOJNM_04368 [bacterium]|nr:hypothetical protein [bacterium]